MATATVQWATVEQWAGSGSNHARVIDADDDTFGSIAQPGEDIAWSMRLTGLQLPADFGSLNSLSVRAVRQYASAAGRSAPNVARIYSRESDGDAWVQRWDGGVDASAKQTDIVSIPVTNPANLQILVESFNPAASGNKPPPPPANP